MRKQYEVIKRTTRDLTGVRVHDRTLKFGRGGAFRLNDASAAKELQKYHKHDVVVAEVDAPHREASRNTFGSLPAMPWAKDRKPWYEREGRYVK